MTSFIRRAGAELASLIARVANPGGETDHVVIFSKVVAGISELFVEVSDGTVYQLTPFTGGADASMLYGNGQDGNVTIAAGTTTLTQDMFYDTLTIQTGGILAPDGFKIFAKTAIIMQGTGKISRRGNDGAVGLQTTGGAGGAALPGTAAGRTLPGSRVGGNGAAGTGGNGAGTTSPPGNTQTAGAGGNAGIANGGTGGTSTQLAATAGTMSLAFWAIEAFASGVNTNTVLGGPGGGGGAGTAAQATGGGGGSGGGYIVVCTPTFGSGGGLIEANGGNGGACNTPTGSAGGGGGGGVGGDIVCVCGDGAFPTLDAGAGSGGAGKNGGGNGGNGQAGTLRRFAGQ